MKSSIILWYHQFKVVIHFYRYTMESHLEHRDRVGVADAVLLEDYESQDAFVNNLQKRFIEDVIYVSTDFLFLETI